MQQIDIDILNILYSYDRNILDNTNNMIMRRLQWLNLKKDISNTTIKLQALAQKIYDYTVNSSKPLYQIRKSDDYIKYKKSNFHGGCNDNFNTQHELLFYKVFPYLQKQRHFGTGIGGYKKYGVKRYIADFVDSSSNTIIEIDGNSHNDKIQKIKDKIRDLFFKEHGYLVIRFKNQDVINLYKLYCNIVAQEVEDEYMQSLHEERNKIC